MLSLIILKFILFLCVVILSLEVIILSNKGFLGVRLQKFFSINSIGELFVIMLMVVGFIMFIFDIVSVFYNYFLSIGQLKIESLCVIDPNTAAQDPVRYWPSGTAQTWGILGTAAGLYKVTQGSHRTKVAVALGSLAISVPLNVYLHAVENPNGFNQLMYSWVHYRGTGHWPRIVPNNVGEEALNQAMANNATEAVNIVSKLNPGGSGSGSVSGSGSGTAQFLPIDNSDILSQFTPDNLILNFMGLFRPVGVEGYLDDLIGQQLFITFLLMSVAIGVFILFTVYFIIQTTYNNREFITKRFNNKYIKFYIKYQIILAKISLIVLPAMIFLGLIELLVGIYFILNHPIPFEELPIDLHVYVKSK